MSTWRWLLAACLVLAAGLTAPAAEAASYFSFGVGTDSTSGGQPLQTYTVAQNDTVQLKVWFTFDPAHPNYGTQTWFATYTRVTWNPSQLQLTDSAYLLPNTATHISGTNARDWVIHDTPGGKLFTGVEYNTNGKMTAGTVYSLTFRKLTAEGATVTLIGDTLNNTNANGATIITNLGDETCPTRVYNMTFYSQETQAPTFQLPGLGTLISGETKALTNVVVYDSSAASGNNTCSMWISPDSTVAWTAVALAQDTYYDTYSRFSGSIPGHLLNTPYISYFFSATDSWGNNRRSPAAAVFTDTTNADSQTVYSNVPLTNTGLGDTTGFADSKPATVRFATVNSTAMAWIYTAADTVYILRGTVNDTVCSYTNAGGAAATTLMACTLPLTAASNTFVAVGRDGVMPWNRTETFTVLWDTVAPPAPVVRINNSATPTVNALACSISLSANDTGSGAFAFVVRTCSMAYGFDNTVGVQTQFLRSALSAGETGTLALPNIAYDSRIAYVYVAAQDSAANIDSSTATLIRVTIDTSSPLVFSWNSGPAAYTYPPDSGTLNGDSANVTLLLADSSAITAAYTFFRHPGIWNTWDTQQLVYLGYSAGDGKLYGCSIPQYVVGPVGTNDATVGVQFFGYIVDAFGQTTWIDSRLVTLNDAATTLAARYADGYDSFTTSDSVYIQPAYFLAGWPAAGISPVAVNWRDTIYVNADTVYFRVHSHADTVRITGQGLVAVDTQTYGHIGTMNWYDSLPAGVTFGRNHFRLIGYDSIEPTRDGVKDTITVIVDTYVPVVTGIDIETGSVGMDSGSTPSLFVRVTAADTLGYDTSGIGGITVTPSFLVLSDTYYPTPQLLAAWDTVPGGAATRLYVKQAFGSGIATVKWTIADTTCYQLYAYVIDRANNVSTVLMSDTVNHDTRGPQVTYAGVPDNRAATQPVTVSMTVTDAGGPGFVSQVSLIYRHPTGYPALNTWQETICQNTGGNTWQGFIPSYAVGGIADTTAGVQYFIRTRDSIHNFAYWGDLDGAAGGALGMYDTTATDTTNGDARYQSNYWFDTFSVVLSVPVTVYAWDTPSVTLSGGLTRVGADTRALSSGLYFASDSVVFQLSSSGIADSITVSNQGVFDTAAGTTVGADTLFRVPLKAGVNTIIITATDTDMPAFYQTYTITADTEAPVMTDGYLFGRFSRNPLTTLKYTDSTSIFGASAFQDSTAVTNYRIGENGTFSAGTNTAWQAYATTFGYTWAAQDTVPLYLQWRDAAGNMTALTADTLYVDTQGPQTALAAVINDSRTANATLNFTATMRDEVGDTPLYAGLRAYVWYSNPNQYGGGIAQSTGAAWDSQPAVYTAGVNWSCSIPAAVIGAQPDSSVAWFLQAYDTFSKASYLVGQGGTATYCYTETMTLAQALASPDTFTTVNKVSISTWLHDGNDTGEVLAANGRSFDSDVLSLRFVTDADTVTVYLTNDVAKCDSVASASDPAKFVPGSLAQVDSVTITGKLRPGVNYLYVRATDADYPTGNDTYVIVCDTVAPALALGTLTLADNDRGNYVAADTLALRAWFAGGDSTTAIGAYRWSSTGPVAAAAWNAFAAPAKALSETVTITLPSGGTTLTVWWQVQDTAGNISDTFTDTILCDTQAPQFAYAGVADSRAAAYAVTVLPAINDLSGTAAITAYLYFRHDTGSSTWDSVALGYTNNGYYYTGDIPSGVVGSSPDSTYPMNEYVLAAKDWFDQWRWFGSNADTSFASLAAAQAKPDSFTTVNAIAMSVYATTTSGVDTRAMADSIYASAGGLTIRVISPNADRITIGHYHAQSGWTLVDTFVYQIASTTGGDTFQPVTRLGAGINVFTVIAEDTAAQAEPTARVTYAIYADTYAPFLDTNVFTAGDAMRIDTDLVTTPDTYVVLYLSLSDTDNGLNVAGAVQYFELSETVAFSDTTTGKVAYTPLYTYGFRNADGDSALTVYLRCWDYAGNTTPVAFRSILWDTQAPVITFTAIADSKPTSRAVPVSATVTDLSGTATVGIVTYHPSTQGGWETWAMSPSGPNTFSGQVPDTVVGGAASLTGVRYYLAATDSWGQTKYWIDNGVVTSRECTSVVYARTLWYDTFTVSLPVTTAVSARDLDTGYTTLVSYGAAWRPVYYRTDSFSISVRTNADSLAVYVFDSARQKTWQSDTFWLVQGATSQDTVIYLGSRLLYDTTFIQVYAFDYTEPSNIDTFAVIGDTRVPYFGTAPVIDGGLYATGDTQVAVAFAAADTYSVVAMIISETHPMFMTDTEARKVAYAASVNYTLTKDTQVATIYVAAFDTAGNMTVATDDIWLDTFPPFIYYSGVADSQSTNQRVAVQATIADTSGTVPAVTLYYQDSTSAWGSTAMAAQVGGTYLGYIPANIVGSDTTFRPRYVIVATDTFNRTTYWGANGDSSFTTLAAAQAKPDSFSLVAPVPTTVTIKDGNDTVALTIAYSGQVFNNGTIGLVVTTSADTLAISIRQAGQTDSFVYRDGTRGLKGDSVNVGTSPVSCTFPVVWHTAVCTFTITVTAGDSDGGSPQFQNSWDIVVDTAAPLSGSARIGSNPLVDTYIGAVSQNVAFVAQDSYLVSTVRYYGDVTSGTAAYTGAAQAVTFTAGEGWKNLFHYYVDGAGNFSQVFGDTFYLDATSGTVTIIPSPLAVSAAAYTCSGTVVDNRIDTPVRVQYKLNGTDTITATVTQSSGAFTGNLVLTRGVNTIRVTATDSAGNSAYDELTVTYADAVSTVVAGTTPVTATMSDTTSSLLAVNLGTSDSVTLIVNSVSGRDTLMATVDFKLPGYTVTVQRLDTATITASLGANSNLNGITSTNFAALDSFIVKFTATDSQGNPVPENSATAYDGITLTWTYGGLSAADEASLHVFYFDPTDSLWKQATTVAGLTTNWPDGTTGEKQSLPNDTIAIRVTHLSIWGVFVGGAPVAANLNNVQIFPNPFKPYDGNAATGQPYDGNPNGMTGIRFINLAASTEIKIYTINGELVDEVAMVANQGLAVWDARNKGGDEVASGIYLVVLRANGQTVVKKVAIIR